jgi:pyruvate dehydrogenase E2 component (dihydrolipoamide acetyltransferase)
MEALSPTMEEGQLVRWLKHEGDAVQEGDILAEIETDKATMELVARGSGVLKGVQLAEGQTAPVGTVIAFIAGADEEVQAGAAPAKGAPVEEVPVEEGAVEEGQAEEAPPGEAPVAQPAQQKTAARPAAKPAAPAAAAEPAATDRDGRVRASPVARRLASEAGVDLSGVAGSGPGGRIVRRDIETATREGPAVAPAPSAAAGPELPDVEEVPISQMRKAIAKRLVTSTGPVPTFYLTIEVDAARLVEARERVNERLEHEGVKTSLNDFIIKALAAALAHHPEVNAAWGESVIRRHHRVHIGVAVAVEEGLITPVVRDADRKPVRQIAAEVKELAGRAREKKLKPEEYTGATFSISNLGMFGIQEFTAIINPPEAGIIAIGAVEEKVVAENGQPVVRPRMRLTMSCDHRVVDGATGARFLQTLRDYLEEPVMILA